MGDEDLVQMQCWAQHDQAATRLLVWFLGVLQVQFPGYQNRRVTSLSLSLLSDLKYPLIKVVEIMSLESSASSCLLLSVCTTPGDI